MSKCLVTGGLGFIGSHVVDQLIEAGHEVTILDNLSTGKMENLNAKADLIRNDIRDFDLKGFEPDYIFHLASLARIQPSIEDPRETHDVNVNGTLNLLEYARKSGAKFIYSSTSSIYYGARTPNQIGDEQPPSSPYSAQKLISEMYIKLYAKIYGLEYVILRYFNVYGERQLTEGKYATAVGIFLESKRLGRPHKIFGGDQRRDFTYVKDVAEANLKAMNWAFGIYNIGTGKNYSIKEVAEMIGGPMEFLAPRAGEGAETLADTSGNFDWQATKELKDWLDEQN